MKKILNDKGLTLIELLLTVAIFSIITTLVVSIMVNMLNYHHRLSNELRLREEADIVMSDFLNIIYTAIDVNVGPEDNIIEVQMNEHEKIYLGFTDGGIAGKSPIYGLSDTLTAFYPVHEDHFTFSNVEDGKFSTMEVHDGIVEVNLHVFDTRANNSNGVQLQSQINFIGRE